MTIEQIVAFNLALLAAMASPGPALLLLIRTAIVESRSAGILTGCGLAFMAATWTGLALLGLEGIFHLVPWAYGAFKIAGALYLLHIAWRTWRGARAGIPSLKAQVRPARRAFWDGLLINLLNPKSVLFAGAVLVVIFPAALPLAEKSLIVINHLAVEIAVYAALACALSTPAVSHRILQAKVWLDRVTALVLGALGIRLLVSR